MIRNFNNDEKRWKINSYIFKGIPGNNLELKPHTNQKIIFKENNVSYDISGFLVGGGSFSGINSNLLTDNSQVRIPITYNNYSFTEPSNMLTKLTVSGDWVDLSNVGYVLNYTPSSNNSKTYFRTKINYINSFQSYQLISFRLLRNISGGTSNTVLLTDASLGISIGVGNYGTYILDYIDSPNTQQQITYYINYKIESISGEIDISSGVIGYDNSSINFMMVKELYIP